MTNDRPVFRPHLEALEDRCQPSALTPVHSTTLHPTPNLLPSYVYNPFNAATGGLNSHTTQQAATPAHPYSPFIYNPFATQQGFTISTPGGYGTAHVFAPYIYNPFA